MAFKLGVTNKNGATLHIAGFGFWVKRAIKAPLRLCHNIDGATAIEYGLLAGLVAVGLAGGLGALADLVNLLFDFISGETTDVATSMTTP